MKFGKGLSVLDMQIRNVSGVDLAIDVSYDPNRRALILQLSKARATSPVVQVDKQIRALDAMDATRCGGGVVGGRDGAYPPSRLWLLNLSSE